MPFHASRDTERTGDLSATPPACVRGQAWHDSHRMDLLSVAWCGRECASCALDSPSAGQYSGPQKKRATGRRACLSPATATSPQSGCGDWVMNSTGVVQGNKASALCGEEHHTSLGWPPWKLQALVARPRRSSTDRLLSASTRSTVPDSVWFLPPLDGNASVTDMAKNVLKRLLILAIDLDASGTTMCLTVVGKVMDG